MYESEDILTLFAIDQLTYLLQLSLGGNSKTLMFVMISPLQAHLSETLTSLKFATKVRFLQIPVSRSRCVPDTNRIVVVSIVKGGTHADCHL